MNLSKVRNLLPGSPSGSMLMVQLQEHGVPITMTEVAALLDRSTAAATGIVDNLEVNGLVERLYDPTDRRKILITLTPKAHERLKSLS